VGQRENVDVAAGWGWPHRRVDNDISTYLHKGHNAIAIHALQLTVDRPPAVAIDGNLKTRMAAKSLWLTLVMAGQRYLDHHGLFWYETEFDDAHWAKRRWLLLKLAHASRGATASCD